MKKTSRELQLEYEVFDSALGWIFLAASSKGISLLHFCGPAAPSPEACEALLNLALPPGTIARFNPQNPLLRKVQDAILDYLHHHQPIPSFPLDARAGTSFQRQVWKALGEIPFGETLSYLQVAQSIGMPKSSRAVGQACGRNPIPILVPCHRVVAANGKLGGFSSGIHIKQALLEIEGGAARA
jgi:methylated-DNA-[protein]-cysteine S-methyltransferase